MAEMAESSEYHRVFVAVVSCSSHDVSNRKCNNVAVVSSVNHSVTDDLDLRRLYCLWETLLWIG